MQNANQLLFDPCLDLTRLGCQTRDPHLIATCLGAKCRPANPRLSNLNYFKGSGRPLLPALWHIYIQKMLFGLCTVSAIFQRCMINICSDMVEGYLEIFMDDFSAFRNNLESCLTNIGDVLDRCQQKNLVMNWENATLWLQRVLYQVTQFHPKEMEIDKAIVESTFNILISKIVKDICLKCYSKGSDLKIRDKKEQRMWLLIISLV